MNKLPLLLLGIFLFSFAFVSAESIGTFKQNQEMQITNYCSTGDCTYANLTSVQSPDGTVSYINDLMTKNSQNFNYTYTPTQIGSYIFNTCSNPNGIAVCDSDTFEVTPTGESTEPVQLWLRVFLILLLISLIILIHWNKNRIDYDKWYSKITQKYQEKNTFKWVLSAVGQIMMKNSYVFSYLVGLLGLLILTDLIYYFNITSTLQVMKIVFGLYTWSALVVVMVFFSQVQEWITDWVKTIQNINWGWDGMR